MDITPLYELRNRLRTAMIAGTNLLSDDFRLKRAVEAVQPLEKAAPVFAKIGELGRSLIAPEQTDKVDALLQVITLLDAVLCTQGMVGISGEIEEINENHLGTAVTNAPYSVVKTLLDALTSSGSGHYSYVLDTHQLHPELFADYRIKTAMVQALGAGYVELADRVADWLKKEGEEILPLLEKDFNPKGKKEMVRRVHVIEAIAGAKANDFYIKQLDGAEKEVRQALIYALRHSPDNLELLMEMTKTEKGNAKKMACFALVHMKDERSGGFFKKMCEKKAQDVMEYVFLSDTEWASKLVAESLKEQLSVLKEERDKPDFCITNKQADFWDKALKALIGKSGDEIMEVYRMAAELGPRLNLPLEEKSHHNYSYNFGPKESSIMSYPLVEIYNRTSTKGTAIKTRKLCELLLDNAFPYYLQLSLFVNPDKRLGELAVELYENGDIKKRKTEYFPAALTAKLLSEEDCCDWLCEELQVKENNLYRGLIRLSYDTEKRQYVLETEIFNAANNEECRYSHPFRQKFNGRFMDVLMECQKANIDTVLCNCVNPEDKEGCQKLEKYFYVKALREIRPVYLNSYFRALKQCGCNKCEGLFQNYLVNSRHVAYWEITTIVENMPGTNEMKAEELTKALELIHKEKARVTGGWNEEWYIGIINKLKAGVF